MTQGAAIAATEKLALGLAKFQAGMAEGGAKSQVRAAIAALHEANKALQAYIAPSA